jgi:hypothetical protein
MSWVHRPECTANDCYCADPDFPDPVCDCGRPGWACRCFEEMDEDLDDVYDVMES